MPTRPTSSGGWSGSWRCEGSEEPDLEEIFVRAVRDAGAEIEVERHQLRA